MQSTGVAATAYTAHREWARRPPDERFASVSALYEAARARRARTEERNVETDQFRTEADGDDDLVLREASGRTVALTHWSFEQLAGIADAPPKYLRTLPAEIASRAINHGLQRQRRDQHQLFANRTAPWTVHAITSPRYARVHHDELAGRVLDLMAEHPAWHLPLGYKDGVYGAERVPSGAYLGDRDMFLFVVDGNRDLEDPTGRSQSGMFRGSSSGTATSAPPPSPWMCSCSAPSAAITSSGAFTTSPPSGAGTWARRFTRRGQDRSTTSAPRSTQTSPLIGRVSSERPLRSSARRARRSSTRSRRGWSCRASTRSRPTGWLKTMNRTRARSGATCRG